VSISLKDRVAGYSATTDYSILGKLPFAVILNGSNWQKLTALLEKPFSAKLAEALWSAMALIVQEIDGAFYGYAFNDEMVIIARNDQSIDTQTWCGGKIQKMASTSAALATLHCSQYVAALDLELMGEPLFHSQVFPLPNLMEASNLAIYKQQEAFQNSIYCACFYELLRKDFDRNDIKELLRDTTFEDKVHLLQQETGIDFDSYPMSFRRGVACYRSPKIISYEGEEVIKHKWGLNVELPIYTKDHGFLSPIFKTGSDIIRRDNE
jgi:tRNA(His) 5'-end guanylyltransferase